MCVFSPPPPHPPCWNDVVTRSLRLKSSLRHSMRTCGHRPITQLQARAAWTREQQLHCVARLCARRGGAMAPLVNTPEGNPWNGARTRIPIRPGPCLPVFFNIARMRGDVIVLRQECSTWRCPRCWKHLPMAECLWSALKPFYFILSIILMLVFLLCITGCKLPDPGPAWPLKNEWN